MASKNTKITKQLLIVEGLDDEITRPMECSFAFVTPIGEERKQASYFYSCRDRLHDVVSDFIFKNGNFYNEKLPNISLTKIRLLIICDRDSTWFKESLFEAKKVLNEYEKYVGWEQTKVTTINHSKYEKTVFMFTGSENWMLHPVLLSLFTLIIKFFTNNRVFKTGDNINIEKTINNAVKDREMMLKCSDKIKLIMKNYKYLFGEDQRTNFSRKDHSTFDFHSKNGVIALCKEQHIDSTLFSRLKNLEQRKKQTEV